MTRLQKNTITLQAVSKKKISGSIMAMTTLFRNIIDGFISLQLKDAGFRRQLETWNRDVNGMVHVINAQESRWNADGETIFTLNIGIMVRSVERILWGKEPPRIVPESSCFPRFRIGYLPGVDAGYDLWWKLRSSSEVKCVGAEVARVIKEKCLPLLDRCQSTTDVLVLAGGIGQWKQPAERLALGVLMCLEGRKDAGQALLDDLEASPNLKGWHPRIAKTRARLRKFMTDHR